MIFCLSQMNISKPLKWMISAAMREATARFNAFEAQYKSDNLNIDRDNAISCFSEEFTHSLTEYIDDLINKSPTK
jgi:hypothetical protein